MRLRVREEETPCGCNVGRANRLSFAMLHQGDAARARRREPQTLSYQRLRRNTAGTGMLVKSRNHRDHPGFTGCGTVKET